MKPLRQLKIAQLDRQLQPVRATERPAIPSYGWIRAIREALGLSSEQLAARLGMSKQSLNAAERREAAGEITLNQLRRIAQALDVDCFYALVPREPLSSIVDRRADVVARQEVEAVAHTMALEDQQTSPARAAELIASVKQRLLAGRSSKLWD